MSILEEFPLSFENMPTDTETLIKKISQRTRTLKVKVIKGGYVAQVRVLHNGERTEVAEIADTPRAALNLLDKRMKEIGLYD